ncbi:MAG: hypothetical protein GFH27_549303n50 [Chloroflexi bacterium AL-W]|nr:hypothetical protein [Chloroflexi bacterium AL-N1]NOK67935.1 hypothetical protein [Chloroflexi bacterium AL-N10]NOK73275.1 hypothetical protein [Chloroflexi bacterium AL-N5]NOK83189.1 hypothetical protein [Chloroflexi bacterium AL-W]NOK87606.1 hypothetical protein [Chloroflexi bacterium AL-N15]
MRFRFLFPVLMSLLAAVISACGQAGATGDANGDGTSGPPAVGSTARLTGEVVDTIDDCAFDGICAYVVDTDQGQYKAIWAPGMISCEGTMDEHIVVGDTVEIFGEVTEADSISICTNSTYSIHKVTS